MDANQTFHNFVMANQEDLKEWLPLKECGQYYTADKDKLFFQPLVVDDVLLEKHALEAELLKYRLAEAAARLTHES